MEFIGAHLKNHRELKKLEISHVSKELMISREVLKSIEDDNFPEFLSQVFLMGHVRAYAKYLELDEKYIISNLKIQISYNKKDLVQEISRPLKIVKIVSFHRSMTFASVLLISVSFYFFFIKNNNLDPKYAITPDLPENLSYDLEEIEMKIALQKNKKKISETNHINENEDILMANNNQKKLANSSSVSASLLEDKLDKVNKEITLKILNTTWIQLRGTNDKIMLSKLMNKGDELSYYINDNFSLTAGNAGNIIVLLNNEVKGKAGKAGEVIDALIIDNSFNN